MIILKTSAFAFFALCLLTAGNSAGVAQDVPGVTATEIVIGQTMPYSGPVSGFSIAGKVEAAYFKMINDLGGINGRKIKLISLDDSYSPAKTVEQTRRLVESDNVLLIFGSLGTATTLAVQKYLNTKKVPQLFIASGASRWLDYNASPWSMAWIPAYRTEARIMAKHIINTIPDAKVAVLYQGDDLGKDYLSGIKEVFEGSSVKIISEASYQVMDPTADSQVVALAASGANVFFNFSSPKYAAQAIRKTRELGWAPTQFVGSIAVSIAAVLRPAGLDNSTGLLSLAYTKTTFDPQWDDDEGMKDYLAFMAKYMPDGDLADTTAVMGYSAAQTMTEVLRASGDDLSRGNVLTKATSLKKLELPMLLPGVTISTSPTDYAPLKTLFLRRFNGKTWENLGSPISE